MSDLHPDHVTPVLALEDPDACSSLVLRSCGYQAAKIIRKLTNDLGYAEQAKEALAAEITRLRERLAALTRERDALRKAAIDAAVAEYLLRHPNEGPDERLGRAAAARGMMVRLGLYSEFEQSLDYAALQYPTALAALKGASND